MTTPAVPSLKVWSNVARGTGDGSSGDNARAFNDVEIEEYLGQLKTRFEANPADYGLNEKFTMVSSKPGTITRTLPDGSTYTERTYVEHTEVGVVVGRAGLYTTGPTAPINVSAAVKISLTQSTMALSRPTGADVGTDLNPVRVIALGGVYATGAPMPYQGAGATVSTITRNIPVKNATFAETQATSNYDTQGNWTGTGTATPTSWQRTTPHADVAFLKGDKTADPRTAAQLTRARNLDQLHRCPQWNIDNARQFLYDPTVNSSEPKLLTSKSGHGSLQNVSGHIYLEAGQIYDPDSAGDGSMVPKITAGSGVPTQNSSTEGLIGLRAARILVHNLWVTNMTLFTCHGAGPGVNDVQIRDCTAQNSLFFMGRTDSSTTMERWGFDRVQHLQAHGRGMTISANCKNWRIKNYKYSVDFCVGDYASAIQATDDRAFNSGGFLVDRFEFSAWASTSSETVSYVQGDTADWEAGGIMLADGVFMLAGDGGWDTKGWTDYPNWPMLYIENVYFRESKRALRHWRPSLARYRGQGHIVRLRNVTFDDPRQYAIYVETSADHVNRLDWWNPSGRAFFMGTTDYKPIRDENQGGAHHYYLRQFFDARSVKTTTAFAYHNGSSRIVSAPVNAALPITVRVEGVVVDVTKLQSATVGSNLRVSADVPVGSVVAANAGLGATLTAVDTSTTDGVVAYDIAITG